MRTKVGETVGKMMEAFDGEGNRLERVLCHTFCPAEWVVEGREIAVRHMRDVETAVDDEADQMLTIGLVPIENPGGEITHFYCAREVFRAQVALEAATLRAHYEEGKTWCAIREMQMADDPEEIKSKFCCVTGETEALLERLGLVRK